MYLLISWYSFSVKPGFQVPKNNKYGKLPDFFKQTSLKNISETSWRLFGDNVFEIFFYFQELFSSSCVSG